MTSLTTRLDSYSSAVVGLFRVVIGFLFAIHGTIGLFAWPVAMGKGAMPFGAWPDWWSAAIELVTGVLVMIGLFTRVAAFFASGEMAVAYFWQHQPHGLWPHANHGEPAVLYCFAFFLLVFIGPGAFSLDARRGKG